MDHTIGTPHPALRGLHPFHSGSAQLQNEMGAIVLNIDQLSRVGNKPRNDLLLG